MCLLFLVSHFVLQIYMDLLLIILVHVHSPYFHILVRTRSHFVSWLLLLAPPLQTFKIWQQIASNKQGSGQMIAVCVCTIHRAKVMSVYPKEQNFDNLV